MISRHDQLKGMRKSYDAVSKVSDAVILEGTGHTGVRSVVDLNNAQVAKRLNADMILVANGGLGSAYDDLALNYLMCQRWGVKVIGIILNKVNDAPSIIKIYIPATTGTVKWNVSVDIYGSKCFCLSSRARSYLTSWK